MPCFSLSRLEVQNVPQKWLINCDYVNTNGIFSRGGGLIRFRDCVMEKNSQKGTNTIGYLLRRSVSIRRVNRHTIRAADPTVHDVLHSCVSWKPFITSSEIVPLPIPGLLEKEYKT